MIRAVIVDDEAIARRRIRRLLSPDCGVTVVGECADGSSAVEAIGRERPDLVFLDIQMPELDGFEVVRRIPAEDLPAVLFVTAHDRYALRAFDVHAIDYLLKPFTRDRFRMALARARDRIERRDHDAGLAALASSLRDRPRFLSRVTVRSAGRVVVLDLAIVDWLEAADNYVLLHAGRQEYILRESLSSLHEMLDPERFVRIHRSAIVQIDRIVELRPATHGDFDVFLRTGTRLTLSRTWRKHVESVVGAL